MAPASLLYITIEYCQADLFSGNGVCARSQVRHLAALSNSVHVICGRPSPPNPDDPYLPNVTVTPVFLDSWFCTDRAGPHEQFAKGAAAALRSLSLFHYDACLAVDWTGTNPLHLLPDNLITIPIIYLNFRSYMSMTNISDNDRLFYVAAERAAVHLALRTGGGIVSLCHADETTLKSLVSDNHPQYKKYLHSGFRVLLPMLRSEFATIAHQDRGKILNHQRKRIYITSLVRLSEDKGAHRFISLLRRLQQHDADIWNRTGVVPLLLGAPTQPEYAQRIRDELRAVVPNAVVMDTFLQPEQLADVLQQAALNIHPALYEAYGLTIVEAASMGCPSVIHKEGIGAAQLLKGKDGAVVEVDIHDENALADTVNRLLCDVSWRNRVAHQAFIKATSWTEAEYVNDLLKFVNERIRDSGIETS